MKIRSLRIISLILVLLMFFSISAFAATPPVSELATLAGDIGVRSTQYLFSGRISISIDNSKRVSTGHLMNAGSEWRIAIGENSNACALTVWFETSSYNQSTYAYIYESNDGLGYGDCAIRYDGTHYATVYNEGRIDNGATKTTVYGYYRDL